MDALVSGYYNLHYAKDGYWISIECGTELNQKTMVFLPEMAGSDVSFVVCDAYPTDRLICSPESYSLNISEIPTLQ